MNRPLHIITIVLCLMYTKAFSQLKEPLNNCEGKSANSEVNVCDSSKQTYNACLCNYYKELEKYRKKSISYRKKRGEIDDKIRSIKIPFVEGTSRSLELLSKDDGFDNEKQKILSQLSLKRQVYDKKLALAYEKQKYCATQDCANTDIEIWKSGLKEVEDEENAVRNAKPKQTYSLSVNQNYNKINKQAQNAKDSKISDIKSKNFYERQREKEEIKKVTYQSSINHTYRMLDLKTQQILDSGLKDYQISYQLREIGTKEAVLANNVYYKAEQERILNSYKYGGLNKNVAIASSIVNSVQQIAEQNRLRKQRDFRRAVYKERDKFEDKVVSANADLKYLNSTVKSYLNGEEEFIEIQRHFYNTLKSIDKVNNFKFYYRKEHKGISDMFFNNESKLKSLFESLYIEEFNKNKYQFDNLIELFLIQDYYYDLLSNQTKEYLADYIATELSKKNSVNIFEVIINKPKIIKRSFTNQNNYYSQVLTQVFYNKSVYERLSYLNTTNYNLIALAILKTNLDVNNYQFYNKYKDNSVVMNFIKNTYSGNVILTVDNINTNITLAKNIKTGLFGYVNSSKEWIISPIYQKAEPFIGKNALVKQSSYSPYMLINQKGESVKKVDDIEVLSGFRNGYAVAKKKNGILKGIVNENLEWIKKPKYVKINLPLNKYSKIKVQTLVGGIRKFSLK